MKCILFFSVEEMFRPTKYTSNKINMDPSLSKIYLRNVAELQRYTDSIFILQLICPVTEITRVSIYIQSDEVET